MGPRGSTEWQRWVIEGRTDEETIKTHHWQEVSADDEDFIGDKEQRGTEGNFVWRETVTRTPRTEGAASFQSIQSFTERSQRHEETSGLQLPRLRHRRVHRRGTGGQFLVSILKQTTTVMRQKQKKTQKKCNKCDRMLCCVAHFTQKNNSSQVCKSAFLLSHVANLKCQANLATIKLVYYIYFLFISFWNVHWIIS